MQPTFFITFAPGPLAASMAVVVATLLASVCAEVAMTLIADRLFDLPARLHPWLWIALPGAGALLVGLSGCLSTCRVTRVPPMQSLG